MKRMRWELLALAILVAAAIGCSSSGSSGGTGGGTEPAAGTAQSQQAQMTAIGVSQTAMVASLQQMGAMRLKGLSIKGTTASCSEGVDSSCTVTMTGSVSGTCTAVVTVPGGMGVDTADFVMTMTCDNYTTSTESIDGSFTVNVTVNMALFSNEAAPHAFTLKAPAAAPSKDDAVVCSLDDICQETPSDTCTQSDNDYFMHGTMTVGSDGLHITSSAASCTYDFVFSVDYTATITACLPSETSVNMTTSSSGTINNTSASGTQSWLCSI